MKKLNRQVRGGLSVFSTLDLGMQEAGERILLEKARHFTACCCPLPELVFFFWRGE